MRLTVQNVPLPIPGFGSTLEPRSSSHDPLRTVVPDSNKVVGQQAKETRREAVVESFPGC